MGAKLVLGVVFPWEMRSGVGHTAATLYVGGRAINYESRGSRGILKGSAARGATNSLFRHRFYMPLTETQARRVKAYADRHVGQRYRWGLVPGNGGDCSGYMSGLICAAKNTSLRRLFATGSGSQAIIHLGFRSGTGPRYSAPVKPKLKPQPPLTAAHKRALVVSAKAGKHVAPRTPLKAGIRANNWVFLLQARLNVLGLLGDKYMTGGFGGHTTTVVKAFQKRNRLAADGVVGPKTWAKLFPKK